MCLGLATSPRRCLASLPQWIQWRMKTKLPKHPEVSNSIPLQCDNVNKEWETATVSRCCLATQLRNQFALGTSKDHFDARHLVHAKSWGCARDWDASAGCGLPLLAVIYDSVVSDRKSQVSASSSRVQFHDTFNSNLQPKALHYCGGP